MRFGNFSNSCRKLIKFEFILMIIELLLLLNLIRLNTFCDIFSDFCILKWLVHQKFLIFWFCYPLRRLSRQSRGFMVVSNRLDDTIGKEREICFIILDFNCNKHQIIHQFLSVNAFPELFILRTLELLSDSLELCGIFVSRFAFFEIRLEVFNFFDQLLSLWGTWAAPLVEQFFHFLVLFSKFDHFLPLHLCGIEYVLE